MSKSVVVVGAGVFGVTAAIELAKRGWKVTLADPGPLPHPQAASTDISKIIRADYGHDHLYIELMERAFPIWREWNRGWGVDLYHQTGFLILAGGAMQEGGFEQSSFSALTERGYRVERLNEEAVGSRFPAWDLPPGGEGYLNPVAGWAESGAVMGRLVGLARDLGIEFREETVTGIRVDGLAVTGVRCGSGDEIGGDVTVVACGVWTSQLVPGLEDLITATGQPVMHFRPDDAHRFRPPTFPPWAADISTTGWYGFPALDDGTVKVANHGAGRTLHPDDDRSVDSEWESQFRAFLSEWIPPLANAPAVASRLCVYTDTTDGDFLIDRHPKLSGLVVTTGGSGHGFKFAPVLGALAADAVEGRDNRFAGRFRWRAPTEPATEPARGTGPRPRDGR